MSYVDVDAGRESQVLGSLASSEEPLWEIFSRI